MNIDSITYERVDIQVIHFSSQNLFVFFVTSSTLLMGRQNSGIQASTLQAVTLYSQVPTTNKPCSGKRERERD